LLNILITIPTYNSTELLINIKGQRRNIRHKKTLQLPTGCCKEKLPSCAATSALDVIINKIKNLFTKELSSKTDEALPHQEMHIYNYY